MPWEKPSCVEVKMDSEIGSYQDEFDERKSGDALRAVAQVEQSGPVTQPAPPRM